MPRIDTVWTDELDAYLADRWKIQQLSAATIARELTLAVGHLVTKNAVMGRLHREGLCGSKEIGSRDKDQPQERDHDRADDAKLRQPLGEIGERLTRE